MMGRQRPRVVLACTSAVLCACASTPDVDPNYRPAESVLEVVAVLRAHIPDDTYRFEPARDFTGRNVYRSSLLRLENLQRLHAESLRAGHMDGVIAFAGARALERLSAFDIAADSYRLASELNDELAVEALRSADVCDALHEASGLTRHLEPADEVTATDPESRRLAEGGIADLDPASVLAEFDRRISLLENLVLTTEGTHHAFVVREEMERADVSRARYFTGVRSTNVDGDVLAVAELQRVITRNPDSKNLNRHMLELADLYADLAMEYAEARPPESMQFDPVRFRELIEGASRLYEMVANRDGTPEKLEASRRLEAFLAFSIRIDRDRFTP